MNGDFTMAEFRQFMAKLSAPDQRRGYLTKRRRPSDRVAPSDMVGDTRYSIPVSPLIVGKRVASLRYRNTVNRRIAYFEEDWRPGFSVMANRSGWFLRIDWQKRTGLVVDHNDESKRRWVDLDDLGADGLVKIELPISMVHRAIEASYKNAAGGKEGEKATDGVTHG